MLTKDDLVKIKSLTDGLETQLKSEFKKGIDGVRAELRKEIGGVRGEIIDIKSDLGSVKEEISEIKNDLGNVKEDLSSFKQTQTVSNEETHKDLKVIRSGVNRLKRDHAGLINYLDENVYVQRQRVDRVEDVLHLPPLKVPELAIVEED